ncbi:PrsW family intramembrane metalloprotease [Nocardioides sp.]|uniref:PrsW family intramembrane metalloprotease n=1 Tax=Nocardioides sp. TaxID=35761 RepID=UPI003D11CC11
MEGTRTALPRWSWLAVLAVGLGLFELLRRDLSATDNPHLVPALLFVGAAVVPTAFVVFIYGRPVAFDVPGGVLALVAATGGVVGVVIASVLEYDTVRDLGLFSMLGVAVIEETAKLIVPAAVLLGVRRYSLPADGLLLGVASGAGFAVLETMGFAYVALVASKGDLSTVDGVLALRGTLSPAAHMAWTGLVAAAFGLAIVEHWSHTAVVRLVLAFGAAVALHTAWDSIGTTPAYLVIGGIGLGSLTAVAHRLRAL